MLVEFISTKFDEYEADRKKKDEMINSLEEKNFRIDWKSWQIVITGWQTGTIFPKKLYSHTLCKTKSAQRHQCIILSEMDLEWKVKCMWRFLLEMLITHIE